MRDGPQPGIGDELLDDIALVLELLQTIDLLLMRLEIAGPKPVFQRSDVVALDRDQLIDRVENLALLPADHSSGLRVKLHDHLVGIGAEIFDHGRAQLAQVSLLFYRRPAHTCGSYADEEQADRRDRESGAAERNGPGSNAANAQPRHAKRNLLSHPDDLQSVLHLHRRFFNIRCKFVADDDGEGYGRFFG